MGRVCAPMDSPLSSRRRITNRRVPPLKRTFPKKKENPHNSHNSQGLPSKRVSKTLDPVSQKPQSMKITLSSSESIGKTSRSRIPHGSVQSNERTRVFAEFWSVWMESPRDDGRTGGSGNPFASSSDVDDGRTATRRGWVKERDDDDDDDDDGSNDRSV